MLCVTGVYLKEISNIFFQFCTSLNMSHRSNCSSCLKGSYGSSLYCNYFSDLQRFLLLPKTHVDMWGSLSFEIYGPVGARMDSIPKPTDKIEK